MPINDLIKNYVNLSAEDRAKALQQFKTSQPDEYQQVGKQFSSVIRKLILLPEDQRVAVTRKIEVVDPESAKQIALYFKQNPGAILEAQGYEPWLKRLGPHSFTRPLAPIQHKFWQWNWPILQKVQENIPLQSRETVGFLPWPRETGKSTHVEWACIAEGALLKTGYVIYLSAKLSQAIDHVVAIRDRIESEKVADLYPWLGKPKLGAHGNKFGWGQEFLMTSGGWAIRPIGADVAARGGKAINIRPTLIVPDDYDELGDSPHVVEHKEHLLTRAILPMGNANTRVLVPQNPIHPNSVVNRMLTGVSLALAMRTIFGEIEDDGFLSARPIPAVKGLVYEIRQSDEGPYSEITQGESLWDGISLDDWQTTLNRVGPSAFGAEYQHDMTVSQEERVLPEYDDRVTQAHVITIDQFEALYGHRRIPSDWPCDAGLDIGYTTGHKSAWTFLSKAPQGVPLAGSIFRYRGRTFTGVGIDEQSVTIRSELWPEENLQRQFMSHEKLGERNVLNTKHGWHFHPCESGKESGVAQWRHYLVCDHTKPHPFHRDEKDGMGRWKIGCPAWFDVIFDSKQLHAPIDDRGLKRHRDGAYNWRKVPVKLTEKGLTVEQPAKKDDDECFVAGTLITTRRGEIPIEEISRKDVVLTRQGWYSVSACGITDEKAEIWELSLSNGSRLRGTKRHPIWVVGYGWKPLSELKVGERLLSSTEYDSIATQTQNIGHIALTLSPMFTRFVKVLAHSTLSYGRQSMAKFQKTMPFTIQTITRLTTPIQILKFSPVLNIAVTTETICPQNSRRECERILSVSKNWRRYGIEALKGENGIDSTLRKALAKLKRLWNRAITVRGHTSDDHFGTNSVRPNASNEQEIRLLRWSVRAWNVARTSSLLRNLRNAHVALNVVCVSRLGMNAPVYNLSVERQPEYFANGVLVHNCDSTRSLLAGTSFGPLEQPMNQTQRVNAAIPAGYHANELAQRTDLDPARKEMTSFMAQYLASKAVKKVPTLFDAHGQRLR